MAALYENAIEDLFRVSAPEEWNAPNYAIQSLRRPVRISLTYNLHTVNDPPMPPLYFILYFTFSTLACSKILVDTSPVGEAALAESPLHNDFFFVIVFLFI